MDEEIFEDDRKRLTLIGPLWVMITCFVVPWVGGILSLIAGMGVLAAHALNLF